MEILRTENLKKIYKTLSGEVRALDGVSLSVEEGEFCSYRRLFRKRQDNSFKYAGRSGLSYQRAGLYQGKSSG